MEIGTCSNAPKKVRQNMNEAIEERELLEEKMQEKLQDDYVEWMKEKNNKEENK